MAILQMETTLAVPADDRRSPTENSFSIRCRMDSPLEYQRPTNPRTAIETTPKSISMFAGWFCIAVFAFIWIGFLVLCRWANPWCFMDLFTRLLSASGMLFFGLAIANCLLGRGFPKLHAAFASFLDFAIGIAIWYVLGYPWDLLGPVV